MNLRTRFVRWAAVVAIALVAAAPAHAFTLVVAPARYSVLQFAFDLLQRTPAVLVSYQGVPSGDPRLHVWNGNEWVPLSLKDYREVNFLEQLPSQTVLIGNDEVLPAALVDASAWAPKISRAYDLTTGALVNDFGRALAWRESEWKWFAKRYNLQLSDEAAPRRASSWYDQPGPLPDRPKFFQNVGRPGPHSKPAAVSLPPVETAVPDEGVTGDESIPPAEAAPVEAAPVEAPIETPADAPVDVVPEAGAPVQAESLDPIDDPAPVTLSDEGVATETDAALQVFETPSP